MIKASNPTLFLAYIYCLLRLRCPLPVQTASPYKSRTGPPPPASTIKAAHSNIRYLYAIKFKILLGLFLLLGVLQQSQALTCKSNLGAGTILRTYITAPIDVLNNAAKGTVLWRSPLQSLSIQCWVDSPTNSGEYVYIYLNPEDPSNTALGPDVELGIDLNGRDDICSTMSDHGPKGHCRINTGTYVPPCGQGNCPGTSMRLSYNLLLVKKSPPGGNSDKDLVAFDGYEAARFDGEGGINPNSLNMTTIIHGLKNLKYIGCPTTITFSNQNINFGTLRTADARANTTASARTFKIIAKRQCNNVFSMNMFMKANAGSNVTVSNLLSPLNADTSEPFTSVAIELKKNGNRIPFHTEYPLFVANKEIAPEQEIEANLIWQTDKPQTGKFRAELIMEFYYR